MEGSPIVDAGSEVGIGVGTAVAVAAAVAGAGTAAVEVAITVIATCTLVSVGGTAVDTTSLSAQPAKNKSISPNKIKFLI